TLDHSLELPRRESHLTGQLRRAIPSDALRSANVTDNLVCPAGDPAASMNRDLAGTEVDGRCAQLLLADGERRGRPGDGLGRRANEHTEKDDACKHWGWNAQTQASICLRSRARPCPRGRCAIASKSVKQRSPLLRFVRPRCPSTFR